MRRLPKIAFGLAFGLALAAPEACAQWRYYPRGYGGYGWGGWGADPQAGYMAGLGAYARGAGVYAVDQAKANAINTDTMIKWNKALRARQKALREEQQKEDARKQAEERARLAERRLEDGTTLNGVLLEVLDFDPAAVRSGGSKVRLTAAAIREIPFEWDTEAITLCIDQLTTRGSLPDVLMDPIYTAERDALRVAVEAALKEDAKGDVSEATRKRLTDAIAAFRAKYRKNGVGFDEVVSPAAEYFNTLAALVPMLNDPSMRAILSRLEDEKGATVGDLIAFMNTYNLRFGEATSPRQIALYRDLLPILTRLRDSINTEGAPPTPPDRTGEGLRSAAKGAFKGMGWDQIEAQSRNP
jgi:hypothetical protein